MKCEEPSFYIIEKKIGIKNYFPRPKMWRIHALRLNYEQDWKSHPNLWRNKGVFGLECNEKRVNRVVLEKAAQLGKLGLDLVGWGM